MSNQTPDLTALHPLLAEAVRRGDLAYGAGGDQEAVSLAAAAPLLDRIEALESSVKQIREWATLAKGTNGILSPHAILRALDGEA